MAVNWGTVAVGAFGAIPGILALAGSLIGFGRMTQRLQTVERDVGEMKVVTAKVAVIEERTKNTDDNVKEVRNTLAAVTETLLSAAMTEIRSYKPPGRRT